MVGISPAHNFEIVAYTNAETDPSVEGRVRKLNRSARLFGPVVGLYRMSTGSLDMIYGLFTLHSELFLQGAKNLTRGSFESMVVLVPLAIALTQRHAIGELTPPVLKEVSLELMTKTYELFREHFVALATTYVVSNLVSQTPLMIYDYFMLKYHQFQLEQIVCHGNDAELYHDLALIKIGAPIALFDEYDCDGKINDLEVYGKTPEVE